MSNTKLHIGDELYQRTELRYKTKIDYFSLCMGFYDTTPGILQSILAGGIFKKVEVAQERALLYCGKREMQF